MRSALMRSAFAGWPRPTPGTSKAGRRSISTTSAPRWANAVAAVSPPTPPPTTSTRRILFMTALLSVAHEQTASVPRARKPSAPRAASSQPASRYVQLPSEQAFVLTEPAASLRKPLRCQIVRATLRSASPPTPQTINVGRGRAPVQAGPSPRAPNAAILQSHLTRA